MVDLKVVSLVITGYGDENIKKGRFLPNRNFERRRQVKNDTQRRIKSAQFYSCLQPIKIKEFGTSKSVMSAPPFKSNNNYEKCSLYRNEINDSFKLMNYRSERDLFYEKNGSSKIRNKKIKEDISSNSVIFTKNPIRCSNSKSTDSQMTSNRISDKFLFKKIKLLSEKDTEQLLKPNITSSKFNESKEVPIYDGLTINASSSNFLSRYITIDEVVDVKNCWQNSFYKESTNTKDDIQHPVIQVEECTNSEIRKKVDKERSAILREYMNVYLDWKATQIRSDQKNNISKLSHKFLNQDPFQRLESFHRIVSESRQCMKKKGVEAKEKPRKLSSHALNVPNLEIEECTLNVINESEISDKKENSTIESVVEENVVEEIDDTNQKYTDDSDDISEIDWLENDDFVQ